MAPRTFASKWRDNVDSQIANDRDYAQALHRIVVHLNNHQERRTALDDVVSQRWGDGRCDWYDAAAQIEIGLRLQAGWCVIAILPLGAKPGRDRDAAENQDKLDALSFPYSARCQSGPGDNDGHLEWAETIRVEHLVQDDRIVVVDFEPFFAPLEIGHTNPETTVWHLADSGAVARWPYGHDKITLLLATRFSDVRRALSHTFVSGQPVIAASG